MLAGYHEPFRTRATPSGIGYPSHAYAQSEDRLGECALSQSEAARVASSHRFEIRLQYDFRAGSQTFSMAGDLEPFPRHDSEEEEEENEEEEESAAFVRAGQAADASRAETWMPGSGGDHIVTCKQWEDAAEERLPLVNGVATRHVRLLLCVHVVAVGERLCTGCGAEASKGACAGCMGIAQWCPVRYCSLACRAAVAVRHQPACHAMRRNRKRTAVNWHDSPGRSWVIGADGVGQFVETGPAGPPLCSFEEDWRHTHAHILVDEACVRCDGEEALTPGAELRASGRVEASNAFALLKCARRTFESWMRRIHPHRLAFYTHDGQRVSVRATTVRDRRIEPGA